MSLVKSIGKQKVNVDFNKDFINLFSQKIKNNDVAFINQTLEDEAPVIIGKGKVIKTGFDKEGTKYLVNVYFEDSPIILRKIEVVINDELLQISIFDHNYNEDFGGNGLGDVYLRFEMIA